MRAVAIAAAAVSVAAAADSSQDSSQDRSQGSLNFLVMADWGGQPKAPFTTAAELSTAAGMGRMAATLNASFALGVGDNFYSSGIKTDASDPRFKNTFENVFTHPRLQSPFVFHMIAGNHDHGGNVTAQIAYTNRSARWNYPDSWFNVVEDLGGGKTLEIVMIDTVILAGNSDVRDENGELVLELRGSELPGPADTGRAASQLAWLEATLAASQATFLVVAGHFPVWSICEHGPTSQMIKEVKPLLERYHVTAFIAGHDHCIESFVDSGVDCAPPIVLRKPN